MSNLIQRLLTAVVLIPLVVAAILYLSWIWMGLLFGLALLAAAWEWTHLAGWQQLGIRLSYLAATAAVLALSTQLPPAWVLWVSLLTVAWWLYAFSRVIAVQRGAKMQGRSPLAWWLTGWILVVPPWLALVELHRDGGRGPVLVLIIMVLVWLADIGAYFAGRTFGKRKLAVNVSPGKSWEGVAGGAALALIGGATYGWLELPGSLLAFIAFMVLCAITVAVSVLGDLTESLFKRESNVKDSGGLLPGHGGVLDRIDSLTAAAPFFYVGTVVLGI